MGSDNDFRPDRTKETGDVKYSAVHSGRGDFVDTLPATMWLANFRLSLRDETERRQVRHICRIQNQTRFEAPSGAEYAAPTGLGNFVAWVATKISFLTELRTGAPNQPQRGCIIQDRRSVV